MCNSSVRIRGHTRSLYDRTKKLWHQIVLKIILQKLVIMYVKNCLLEGQCLGYSWYTGGLHRYRCALWLNTETWIIDGKVYPCTGGWECYDRVDAFDENGVLVGTFENHVQTPLEQSSGHPMWECYLPNTDFGITEPEVPETPEEPEDPLAAFVTYDGFSAIGYGL
eukprot:UN02225